MALNNTTVAAAVLQNDVTLNLTATTGNAVGNLIRVDNEYMVQTGPAVGTFIPVRRGLEGSAVLPHNILANVNMGLFSDFSGPSYGRLTSVNPEADPDVISIGANTTLTAPVRNTIYYLTKATALASTTLPAPSTAQNGMSIAFTSQTAAAHVITATSLIADGVTGSPHTTATWAAFKGATLVLTADAGLWNVTSAVGVTIS